MGRQDRVHIQGRLFYISGKTCKGPGTKENVAVSRVSLNKWLVRRQEEKRG